MVLELLIITLAVGLEIASPRLGLRYTLPRTITMLGPAIMALILLESIVADPVLRVPVQGASHRDWHPDSYWHPNWGQGDRRIIYARLAALLRTPRSLRGVCRQVGSGRRNPRGCWQHWQCTRQACSFALFDSEPGASTSIFSGRATGMATAVFSRSKHLAQVSRRAQRTTRQRTASPARSGTTVSGPSARWVGTSQLSRLSVMESAWRGRP